MTPNKTTKRLSEFLRKGNWKKAQQSLRSELKNDPENHWLLTQLGVTLYEQKRYQEALDRLAASLKIVPDCPLTLWNLAGTLDALGRSAEAKEIYTWLLESGIAAQDDPCWESEDWADALRVDCIYRLGVCFQNLGKKKQAEVCYLQYQQLLASGVRGTYTSEDVLRQLRSLRAEAKNGLAKISVQKAVDSVLQAAGVKPGKARRHMPPSFDEEHLLVGSKK